MSFLEDKCSLFPVVTPEEMNSFTCGDYDLDEFFTNGLKPKSRCIYENREDKR